ncbi:MAG TPA: lanthionine synthetase LanC family protein [Puia sp.]|uniref:class III lanthionine synthetase LanKC N-terminal domain-containing protein n=1 Tax=Puia sp. TaxID=2045100 RepID=UPI002C8C41A3|nr:lanthionine synthetase LanC family protein [Puia sp.]HVU95480.1 lanthionine synthetase LanC family protein [Puia sp.]
MHKAQLNIISPPPATGNSTASLLIHETEDFAELLASMDLQYNGTQYYWEVGQPSKTQGWIIHLSVIKIQVLQLLKIVIPELVGEKVPFKVARNRTIAEKLLNGNYGAQNLGKIVAIFPDSDQQAVSLATTLIRLTAIFKGPSIPTDFCLENIVHTRYGSFSPVWINDEKGKPVKHIYNAKNELIPDIYHIPFTFPTQVDWPFARISEPVLPIRHKLLNGKYYPIDIIKTDYRGTVQKAIYFKRLWNIKACVLKEARKNMISDDTGRDHSHRLQWQFQLCRRLADTIPVPRVFDTFTEHGDTYLAIEFVKGMSVADWLTKIYRDRVWFELPSRQQVDILRVLLKVIDIVDHLHKNGLIHRDISPGNFIVTNRERVIPIDLELAWSYQSKAPSPPFQLGTPGYMSPQQAGGEIPTLQDDVYSLGGLVVKMCTKLNPTKLPTADPTHLRSSLKFFTRDDRLADVATSCLQLDAAKRPDLRSLKTSMSAIIRKIETGPEPQTPPSEGPIDEPLLKSTIQSALNCLASPKMLSKKGRWVSFQKEFADSDIEELDYSLGWHTGMAGPLWLLAVAKAEGFDLAFCMDAYYESWSYIYTHYFKSPQSRNPSLYYGGAGISLALTEGLNSGLLSSDSETLSRLKSCFAVTPAEPTLSTGWAGQGLAALVAAKWLDNSFTNEILETNVKSLVDAQQHNGSWHIQASGLDNGTAGILSFLITYVEQTSDHQLETVLINGLGSLISDKSSNRLLSRIQKKSAARWRNSQSMIDLTMIMIRSYEVLGDIRYKQMAEKYLLVIPSRPVDPNFSLDDGLTKIGTLWLLAYRVFKDPHYLAKATWIAKLLIHTIIQTDDNAGFWMVSGNPNVTADLYTGNSGIIYYLMRYWQSLQNTYMKNIFP